MDRLKPPNKNRPQRTTGRLFLAALALTLTSCDLFNGSKDNWGSLAPPPTLTPRIFTQENCHDIQLRGDVVPISPEEYERAKRSLEEMFTNPNDALRCLGEKRPVATHTPTPSK
jgi:hypothetical protein